MVQSRLQNVPGKTGNKVICVKPSSDLEKIFAYQVILSVNWHKVLYPPFSLFQFQKWTVTGNQKETETTTVKSILEFFFQFSLLISLCSFQFFQHFVEIELVMFLKVF